MIYVFFIYSFVHPEGLSYADCFIIFTFGSS